MELTTRELDNDTRGWIMCIVSGIACIFGASIVCVDVIIRLIPGKRNFRIQDSNVFLACSLSLSFGVMLFSSLYSMLPEAKQYLKGDDWSDQSAGLLVMSCFSGGFFGIQAVSRLLHQFMPSHVVDCDHSHGENTSKRDDSCDRHSRQQSRTSRPRHTSFHPPPSRTSTLMEDGNGKAVESTPLLVPAEHDHALVSKRHASATGGEMLQRPTSPLLNRGRATTTGTNTLGRRPSMLQVQKRVMSFVRDTKCGCDVSGPCYGFTDPCAQECFKHLSNRSSNTTRHPTVLRTTTGPFYPHSGSVFHGGNESMEAEASDQPVSPRFRTSRATSREPLLDTTEEEDADDYDAESHEHGSIQSTNNTHDDAHHHAHSHGRRASFRGDDDTEAQHHHHVPTNAFLSIGLQTSIAIALHKFPEGFITYATNHANPALGFNVFMALFVHNITEGFAMCLPLYMALGSRWRAMAWSAVLGGLSQPLGAGIAVLWFKVARKTHMAPNAVAYSCLFAATAGIMVSVALQLFVEGLSFNHNRNLCIFFGFLGMALLGFSNALFAGH